MSYLTNNSINKYKVKVSRTESIIDTIIPIISLFMFVYLPTSNNSKIYGNGWIITIWALATVMVLILYFKNKSNTIKSLMIFLFVTIYMSIITLVILNINSYARISIARIAPILLLTLLYSIKIDVGNQYKLMTRLLDLFFITMIIWNILILVDNSFINEFTTNYYSQYYNRALFYSLLYNKTVMSFGVHTYASYFYMLFFYMSYQTAKVTKKRKYYLYCISATIFTFFLTSNTSIIYGIIMVFMLLKLFKTKPLTMIVLLLIGVIVLINFYIVLTEKYLFIFQSNSNGFIARYLGEDIVFQENINYILNNYAIGFNILDNVDLNYSDSGYMVYLTMGNFPLLFIIYYWTFRFLKNNIPKDSLLFILFIVFSFEVALPATFNYRYIYAMIFLIYYLQSLENNYKLR
ncbi:MAG: hypothetical protein M0Q14_04830 [Tissierellaceae bacterium]|nr:hypothetical protein [Tissierellaceae bacterium]